MKRKRKSTLIREARKDKANRKRIMLISNKSTKGK